MKINTTDVFKTQGVPTYTYVSASNGSYEKQLAHAIQNYGTLCLITGPSKTGKTTLVSNVCETLKLKPLIVRCDDTLSIREIWKKILEQVDFSRVSNGNHSKKISTAAGAELGGKLGWHWLASLTGKTTTSISTERSEDVCREKILADPGPEHLIPILKHSNYFLIVEDFHYLKVSVQMSLFQQWKVFVDHEISVAVIGTTHHACDLAFANKDLIGRVYHLQLTTWLDNDLENIASKGFNTLKVKLDDRIVRLIAQESVGLPLLTQAICLEIALKSDVEKSFDDPTPISLKSKDVFKHLNNLAVTRFEQFESIYKRISRGLRNHKKRKYNTYELLLSVFSIDPIVYKLENQDITDRLKKLPLPNLAIPSQLSIRNSLSRLSQLQKKMGVSVLEWYARDETLYILEPSFLFYLRWRKQRSSSPRIYELFEDLLKNVVITEKRGRITVSIKPDSTATTETKNIQ